MTLKNIKAVAIDLDGTLLDTITDLCLAANLTLREMSLPEQSLALLKTFIGKGNLMHVRRSLTAAMGRDPTESEFARATKIYREQYFAHIADTTVAFPGVREGLAELQAHGLPLACVTNKARAFTVKLLALVDLAKPFDFLVCGDDLPQSKPDPMMFVWSAGRFGVSTTEQLVIGDSANDADAARAAGSPVLLTTYGYTEGHPLASIPNDGMIDSFKQIQDFLST